MENNEPIPAASGASGTDVSREGTPKSPQVDYVAAARSACASGDDVLGIHLYLAAFEIQNQDSFPPSSDALDALRSAWKLAISLKERSIAEYIFEKLEPFVSAQEMGECADALQQLALDRLEEFGLSRDELEQMADALSDDFFGSNIGQPSIHIEQFSFPAKPAAEAGAQDAAAEQVDDGQSQGAAPASADAQTEGIAAEHAEGATAVQANEDASVQAAAKTPAERESYADLVGFDEAIADMRSLGIGMGDDPEFKAFVEQLNALHGLDRMPSADSLVFRAVAREDANRFLAATLREIGLPVIRMSFEESLQGVPMLVVSSEGIDFRSRQNFMRLGFTQPMSLVMEDIDLWTIPEDEISEEKEAPAVQANAARGAREALNIIRSAVANPNVYVLASASSLKDVDPFFIDLLAPTSVVDIELPGDDDRRAIWGKILAEHGSLRHMNLDDLVRLSDGMPRFDIESAAHEAIEEAYKQSLLQRRFVAVSAQNIFEKLANYQPLESEIYRDLEEKVIDDFRRDLAHINDILNEGE